MPRLSLRLIGATVAVTALAVTAVAAAAPEQAVPPRLVVADAGVDASAQHRPLTAADITAATRITAAATASTPPGTPALSTLSRHVAPACVGNGSDGKRVRVLYVRESTTKSRYAAVAPVLRAQVAGIDDLFAVSSAKWGGGLRVRWVHDSNCRPTITQVVLPKGSLRTGNWTTFRNAMKKAGFTSKNRKYLVFADANAICGLGDVYLDSQADPAYNYNNGREPQFGRVDAPCWLPGSSVSGSAPAHELMHTLGAVMSEAPHGTPAGHCTDTPDIMCYKDATKTVMRKRCSGAALFDCRGDDYFSLNPAAGSWLDKHWNTANSSFLTKVAKLPTIPTATVAASRARPGRTFTVTAKTTGAVTYRWSGPGITSGSKSSTVKARVRKSGTAKYKVTVAYRNGRKATFTTTVRVR